MVNNMDAIQNFWNQFKKINLELYLREDLPADLSKRKLCMLSQALSEYHKDLGFIIKNSTPQAELTISAHGNPYLFHNVELLVQFAPSLARWKITALVQPVSDLQPYIESIDLPIMYQGVSIKVSDSLFKIYDQQSKSHPLGIQVLLKNHIVFKDHPSLREAVENLIEHLIGEKAFATLSFIDMAQLTSKNRKYGLPLYQLYDVLFWDKVI